MEDSKNLPIFLKNAMKKAKDLQILDKELIKNLNLYKNNEKKPLYQNIQQKLINNKDKHKKNVSCYNEKNPSNSKMKAALTSKEIVDSLEKIQMGAFSEENRQKYKQAQNKKLNELMKSYEIGEFKMKKKSINFKNTRFLILNDYFEISFLEMRFPMKEIDLLQKEKD